MLIKSYLERHSLWFHRYNPKISIGAVLKKGGDGIFLFCTNKPKKPVHQSPIGQKEWG